MLLREHGGHPVQARGHGVAGRLQPRLVVIRQERQGMDFLLEATLPLLDGWIYQPPQEPLVLHARVEAGLPIPGEVSKLETLVAKGGQEEAGWPVSS